MIHVDTSFLIRACVPGSSEDTGLRDWLRAGETLCMSTIAWAEFLCGPVDGVAEQLATEIITHRRAFGEADAGLAARLFNESGRRRGTLVDCMIAAAALADDAALATANVADFRRLEASGLILLDGA